MTVKQSVTQTVTVGDGVDLDLSQNFSGGAGQISFSIFDRQQGDTFSITSAGRFTWKASSPGSFTRIVRGCDGRNSCADLTVILTVKAQPLKTVDNNKTYSFKFNDSVSIDLATLVDGGFGDKTYVLDSPLPAEYSLSNGAISGKATKSGKTNRTVTVSDKFSNSTMAAFTLDVAPPPLTLSVQDKVMSVEIGKSLDLNAFEGVSGGEGTLSFALKSGTLPADVRFDPATGHLTGTPKVKGDFPLVLKVSDSVGQSSDLRLTMSVTAPAFSGQQTITATPLTVGMTAQILLADQVSGGFGGRTYTLNGFLPNGLAMDFATGVISGTPTALFKGSVTITVRDSVNQSYDITLNLQVSGPTITFSPNDSGDRVLTYNAQAEIALATPLTGIGPFTYTLAGDALQGGLTLQGAKITGKPTELGEKSITVNMTDALGTAGQYTFKVKVVAPEFTAVAPSTKADFTVGQRGSFKTFTSTAGQVGSVSYSISPALPANLGLTFDSGTGDLAGTPLRALASAEATSYTVTVTDNGALNRSVAQKIALTIAKGVAGVTLVVSNPKPKYNEAVKLTVTVTGPAGAVIPFGSVDIMDGASKIGTATLSAGKVEYTVAAPLKSGAHVFKAVWAGDLNYLTGSSNTVTVTSGRPDPTADKNLRAIVASQVAAAQRFASSQIDTVQRRLESLHEDVPDFVNGISVSQAGDPLRARAFDDPVLQDGLATRSVAGRAMKDRLRTDDRLQAKPSANPYGALPDSRFKVWTSGSIIFGGVNISSLGVETKTHFTLGGLTAGVDTKLTDNMKGGFAVSYSGETSDIGTDGSRLNSRSLLGSAYVSWKVLPKIFLDGLIGYGGVSFDSKRYDASAASFINGDRRGRMFLGSLALSYDEKFGALSFSPYARLDAIAANLGEYTEKGDENWIVSYHKSTISSQSVVLGLRGEYAMLQNWGVLSPTARLEYRRILNGDVTQTMSYANEPETSYALTTTSSDHDMFAAALGLKARSDKDVTGAVEYLLGGGMKTGLQGQGLRGTLRVGF